MSIGISKSRWLYLCFFKTIPDLETNLSLLWILNQLIHLKMSWELQKLDLILCCIMLQVSMTTIVKHSGAGSTGCLFLLKTLILSTCSVNMHSMAIPVVEFSREENKILKVFCWKSIYSKKMIEFCKLVQWRCQKGPSFDF